MSHYRSSTTTGLTNIGRCHHGACVWGLALLLATGCSDPSPGPDDDNPVNATPFVAAVAAGPAIGQEIVYVSLPSGVIPEGRRAALRVMRGGDVKHVDFIDGGFDPVAVAASVGDSIEVVVETSSSEETVRFVLVVPRPGRPVIVRTQPPKNKRDVPLNSAMIVVFSEPIDSATVTATAVMVRRDSVLVAGRLEFADAAHVSVVFIPLQPLAENADYELVVTQDIRDLAGNTLESGVAVPFTTTAAGVSAGAGVIAFVRGGNIHAVNVQGSVVVQLTTGGHYSAPVWSPEGRRLAFTGSRYPTDIYVMVDDEDRFVRRMMTDGGTWGTAAWSPDGQRILYVGGCGIRTCMSVMSAETGAISPVRLYGNATGEYPSWSPDGTRIAFVSDYYTWNVAWDIYVATVDGSSISLLTDHQYYPSYPAWSPDGASIAFVRGWSLDMYNTRYNLAVMNADGTNVRELAWVGDHTEGAPGSISWSPDGGTIAFTAVDCDLTLQTSCSKTPSIRYVTLDGSRRGLIVANGADPSWKR